ncbi:MAG: uridine diphosphate-N-acetylglucosamine-binding protein YvcK [Bacilli bacterium]|nr:uridine diphosphate-N-acetylglucosamine-binding protein YvcK [Bacilli bacterium]
MNKKVVVLGGGTGMSFLIKGLKNFPLDITTIVSVCDDGRSTGKLRTEFNIPAVGDIRKILIAFAETEPLVEKLLEYRFDTSSTLSGHTVGNLLLAASTNITGNMSDGIEALGKVLNLKGHVIPLTEDNVTLVGKMEDGSIIEGEHLITQSEKKVVDVYYKKKPRVKKEALIAIKESDLIVLSMGSIYTSILPNLICDEILKEIDNSKAKIVYTCNLVTQPGETDDFKLSDHIKILNRYLGNRKIDVVIANNGNIDEALALKYSNLEQKLPVIIDAAETKKEHVKIISENLVTIENSLLRHDTLKLGYHIFSLLMR